MSQGELTRPAWKEAEAGITFCAEGADTDVGIRRDALLGETKRNILRQKNPNKKMKSVNLLLFRYI